MHPAVQMQHRHGTRAVQRVCRWHVGKKRRLIDIDRAGVRVFPSSSSSKSFQNTKFRLNWLVLSCFAGH